MAKKKQQNQGNTPQTRPGNSNDNNNNNNTNIEANLHELSNLSPNEDFEKPTKGIDKQLNFKQKFYFLIRHNAHLYPLAMAILVPFMCLFVYCWAVTSGDVEPILPYVSDAGATAPYAPFLSIMLDLMAVLSKYSLTVSLTYSLTNSLTVLFSK